MLNFELKMFIALQDINPISGLSTASDGQIKQNSCVLALGELGLQKLLQVFLVDVESRQIDHLDTLGIDILDADHFANYELNRDVD